ncbi:phosphotransferase family protein [Nocardioides aequoreus]|uniref:phosphotransferase family protein n=1 Tax=Nocardioides aequoreus TaxID=397278 RepID=UPI00068F7CC6|nr:aminoglycoside phosphotransferase family protein [Nocardioides aequoreus]
MDLAAGLEPLDGGWSGETFLAHAGEERSVVRIYGGRSLRRGPRAPEVDAAVLHLVAPVVPVPRVLEVRPGDPERDVPGLLVCSLEPGERLDLLLPGLDESGLHAVGSALGTLLGRLGLVLQVRAGLFATPDLVVEEDLPQLGEWVAGHLERLPAALVPGLREAAEAAQDLLAEDRRRVLVHGDLNPKNVLVDPATLEVTAVLDWEFAHAGGPWEDLGNLLRHVPDGERGEVLADAVLAAYAALVPGVPDDVRERARASDLASLVELAARREDTPPVRLARERLLGWTAPGRGA